MKNIYNSNKNYDPSVTKQLRRRVINYFKAIGFKWVSLETIAKEVFARPASLGSTIRDLRRTKFGAHLVESKYFGHGKHRTFVYRAKINSNYEAKRNT